MRRAISAVYRMPEKDTVITTRWQPDGISHLSQSLLCVYVFARSSYPLPNFHISGASSPSTSPSTSSSATGAIAAKLRCVSSRSDGYRYQRKEVRPARHSRVMTRLLASWLVARHAASFETGVSIRRIDFNLPFYGFLESINLS